eukprot:scaffold4595_cov169-Skeletonema_marinoi.AAC.1
MAPYLGSVTCEPPFWGGPEPSVQPAFYFSSLGPGWTKFVTIRKDGSGRSDHFYLSPPGPNQVKKRSLTQAKLHHQEITIDGTNVDVGIMDSGNVLPASSQTNSASDSDDNVGVGNGGADTGGDEFDDSDEDEPVFEPEYSCHPSKIRNASSCSMTYQRR